MLLTETGYCSRLYGTYSFTVLTSSAYLPKRWVSGSMGAWWLLVNWGKPRFFLICRSISSHFLDLQIEMLIVSIFIFLKKKGEFNKLWFWNKLVLENFKGRSTYSVTHISIHPSKELCSKIATGEVDVILPWWCHTLVLPPPGYWGLFLSPIIFS